MIEFILWALLIFGFTILLTELSILRSFRMFLYDLPEWLEYKGNKFKEVLYFIRNIFVNFIQGLFGCAICISFWVSLVVTMFYNPIYEVFEINYYSSVFLSGILGMSTTAILTKQSAIY